MLVKGAQAQPPVGDGDAPEGYEDLERIDQGGFATVYRARESRFDRTVALKVLRSDILNDRQLRRFHAECLATGRLSSHPNIVTVYDAGTTLGHRPWLAMEYCSGGSLANKVASQGPLPVADVISIGARLCSALQAAHEAGILHRDVKPQNVLLTSYGEPALADFGIASVVIEGDTATETAAYTVVHAAPEILEGKVATPAADLYSLGSTLYTLLAGQAPFETEARTGLAPLVTRIMRNNVPAIARSGVPPELEQLLRRCMAAAPQDRPASAADLGVMLSTLGQRLAVVSPAVTAAATPCPAPPADGPDAPAVSSSRMLLILGGTLTVLLAAFTGWGMVQPPTEGGKPSRGTVVAGAAQAAARYTPRNVVVRPGPDKGEVIVSWNMPIRPDVVATVIFEGPDVARARGVVNYGTSPHAAPQATLRGLPSGQRVCLSVTHLVSLDKVVTNAVGRPGCALAR
ncbi:MAG: serine/threonine-protein kinase [Actinomycetota bacterium]